MAIGCPDGDTSAFGINFREELRASPPTKLREVTVWTTPSKVSRPLNFAVERKERARAGGIKASMHIQKQQNAEPMQNPIESEGNKKVQIHANEVQVPPVIRSELEHGVNTMWVEDNLGDMSIALGDSASRLRVPFEMNMTEDEDMSDNSSVANEHQHMTTVVERFHARWFGSRPGDGGQKHW